MRDNAWNNKTSSRTRFDRRNDSNDKERLLEQDTSILYTIKILDTPTLMLMLSIILNGTHQRVRYGSRSSLPDLRRRFNGYQV